MKGERDVCVVMIIVFSILALEDLAFLGAVIPLLVFNGVLWEWLPPRVALLLFGAVVPIVSFGAAVNSMVRYQQGVPDEVVLFVVALGLGISRFMGQLHMASVAISWCAYAWWTGEPWRLMVLVWTVAAARTAQNMGRELNLANSRRHHAHMRDGVTRRMDDVDGFRAAIWEGSSRNSWEIGPRLQEFVLENRSVALIDSRFIANAVVDGRSDMLAIRMRNLVSWAERWDARLLGFHGDVLIFVCAQGPTSALDMTKYMMDRLVPCAGVVDVVRLPIRLTDHGLKVDPNALRTQLALLQPGALCVGPAARGVLELEDPVVYQTQSGASPEALGGVPTSYADYTPFRYHLDRMVDDTLAVARLWPAPTHPLWILAGLVALGFNYEYLIVFSAAMIVGPGVWAAWWFGYPDMVSPLLGILHMWAVVNARGAFPVVAAVALVPGAPGLVFTLLAAMFAARRTSYLVLLGAASGYAAYFCMVRDQERKQLRATVNRLVANYERVNTEFTRLWRTHIPDLVDLEPTRLDGWFVLRNLGTRVVAYVSDLPRAIQPGHHVVHALTGGCWIISSEEIPADVDAAVNEMREALGPGAVVEVCNPHLMVLGGDVLVVNVFGPTRATCIV